MTERSQLELVYEVWRLHTESCQVCFDTDVPESGCDIGRNQWRDYLSARVAPPRGRALPAGLGADSDHVGMTLAVYRINPRTGERTIVRPKTEVTPVTVLPLTDVYPACRCPLCRSRR